MANALGCGDALGETIRDEYLPRQIMNWRSRRWRWRHRGWNLCRPRHIWPAAVGRVRVAAAAGHVVTARFAFGDHASNAAFETRCPSSLLERILSRRRFWLFAQNHQLFAV